MKANAVTTMQPLAKPSIPSVRFTAFDVPAITSTAINTNAEVESTIPFL